VITEEMSEDSTNKYWWRGSGSVERIFNGVFEKDEPIALSVFDKLSVHVPVNAAIFDIDILLRRNWLN